MRVWSGGVAERLIAPVLKTGRPKGLVSSNLTPSVFLAEGAQEVDCMTLSKNDPLILETLRMIRPLDSASQMPNDSAQFSAGVYANTVARIALVVACEKVPTRDPLDLARVFHPIFAHELLAASQLSGLAVNLQNPVKARVLIKVNSSTSATDLARNLHDKPQQWLRLQDSQLLLYSQPQEVQSHDSSNLELRFPMPEGTARLLLEHLAKADTPQAAAY